MNHSRTESHNSVEANTDEGNVPFCAVDVTVVGATNQGTEPAKSLKTSPRLVKPNTHGSQLSYSSQQSNVTGSLRLPKPRLNGNGPYLRQLISTSMPLMGADLAVLVLATCTANLLGFNWLNAADATSAVSVWLPPVAFALVLLNAGQGLYPGVGFGTVDEIRRLSRSFFVVTLVAASSLRTGSDLFWDRTGFLVIAFSVCMLMGPYARSIVRRRLANFSWWGFPTLVCGNDSAVFGVWEWLSNNRRLGLKPLGVIADPTELELDQDAAWFVGDWPEARELADRNDAYWAVHVESAGLQQNTSTMIDDHLGNIPHVLVISHLTGIPDHWNRHRMQEGLAGFMVQQHLLLPIPQIVKRGMDLVIAALACLFLVPLFVVLGVAIKITSPGPIFYGHTRVGKGNSRFKAWKFRTMVADADKIIDQYIEDHPELREEWERDHKLKNDPRVTTLGSFMRKWSVDELPQVGNVLCGEMSIVGPRPIVPNEIEKYGIYFEVFCSVLPGITGMWQVSGRNDTTFEERIRLGMYYIHHWSPWLDLYLLFRTVGTVLFTKGAY